MTEQSPSGPAVTPKDIKVQIKEQRLVVDWSDGARSEFALAALRKQCPCATCRTERESRSTVLLPILKSDPTGVHVTSANLVGNYAIQFHWSDGHNTGIFDFKFLRSLAGEQPAGRSASGPATV